MTAYGSVDIFPLLCSSITLLAFFLRFVVFNFQESPKFLVHQGKDDAALKVLQHIAAFNKKKCKVYAKLRLH